MSTFQTNLKKSLSYFYLIALVIIFIISVKIWLKKTAKNSTFTSNHTRNGSLNLPHRPKRTLVVYFFSIETFNSTNSTERIKSFIEIGVDTHSHGVDYAFMLQNGLAKHVDLPGSSNHAIIVNKFTDCVDFGAYGHAVEYLGGPELVAEMYSHVVFINSAAQGPILPKYWPKHLHWTRIFTSRLIGDVHACSISIGCKSPNDPSGPGK